MSIIPITAPKPLSTCASFLIPLPNAGIAFNTSAANNIPDASKNIRTRTFITSAILSPSFLGKKYSLNLFYRLYKCFYKNVSKMKRCFINETFK